MLADTALRRFVPCLAAAMLAAAAPALAQKPRPDAAKEVELPGDRIVAIVNKDVISTSDVNNRTRLFVMSTGLPASSQVIDRLKPQIVRQLIDERLRMQEAQRRKIVVPDQQIAAAIREIEARNGLPAGALRARLSGDGISQRTLVSQIRTQLAWTLVLREQLGERVQVTDSEIAEYQALQAQQIGRPEYRVGEIFIPIDDPSNTADAQRFAETVIQELRAGAPFPLVAAQFSQTQTALEGGELGWVQPTQLDPHVARLVTEMPAGAISNPVKVPGGYSIVTVQGKREIGRDMGTMLSMRQVFLPFAAPLNPQAPTEQQRQTLEKARGIAASARSCEQIESLAKANNSPRPADPGEVRLEGVTPPQFRQMLASLPIGKASEPLVSADGIAVMMVCSRDQKNLAGLSKEEARRQILNDRVELLSRQMMRDLHRQANIDRRDGSV
ncbi:MAG: peptidylprolyl isomerase [Acetobacteraceae bacterium]